MESSTVKGFLLGAGLVALLVLAFVAGGRFSSPNKEEKNTPQQVTTTAKNIESEEKNTPSTPAAPLEPEDKRQLISSETEYEQQFILDTFLGKFNTSLATANFIYTNAQKGIEMTLPWNPLWGTSAHKIAQYETTKNGINFGFMEVCGEGAGCLWRELSLTFLPTKSLAQEKKDRASSEAVFETFNIDGLTVLSTAEEGLCALHTLTVIGKKYNYDFDSACGLPEERIAQIKKIIATIKFI